MKSSTETAAAYYRILGISPDATPGAIRAAYRDKIRLWHPDHFGPETEDVRRAATETTVRLNQAYECLSDPDRRAAYDISSRAATASTRSTSTQLLVLSPQTLRCDVAPGDTIRLTIDVQTDNPPEGNGSLRVRTPDQLAPATFTTTALTANRARVTVRADTSKLGTRCTYRIPIVVTWGKLSGTAILVVHTDELRKAHSKSPSRQKPRASSRHNRARRPNHRRRDLAAISLGGIVLPLLLLAWATGLSQVSTPANPRLVAAICAGVIAATTWLIISSRLMREPDRLAYIGIVWSRLMRWSGWILVGSCAAFLGIPAVVLTLVAVFATPILGLVVIVFISGRFDSQSR